MSMSPPRSLASVLEAAVAFNNQGAAAASSPDQWRNHTVGATAVISSAGLPYFEQAVVLLRTSLAATAAFTENETNDSLVPSPGAPGPTPRSCASVVVPSCPTETNYLCSANHNCADDGGYFVFLRPLTMALQTTNAPTRSHQDFCATGTTNVSTSPYQDYCAMESVFYLSSRIILFNMALMWHAAGMNHAPGHAYRLASWTKAGQIYDMLLRCQSTDKASDSGRASILPALYCLALNNRAALHFQKQEHLQYQECLRAMRQMLPLALVMQRPTTLNCDGVTMLHPKETRELLCNVLLLDAPLNACPAVAA